jgi:conjugal transfer pilus assembly protein TraI
MQSSASNSTFPATDPGFAALPVADLLASADELVGRIRLCFGLSRDAFDDEVQPLLQRYATYVHLLPATADNYFSAPAGLLNLGLEVAFFSLQGTDAHIFSGRSTISARRQLEPRWRLATFIGGLCCELHQVLSHLIVTDQAGGEWPQFLTPLADWLASRGADRYFVRWRPNASESRGMGVFALPLVIPAITMQYLAQDNTVIVPHLLASIGGQPVYRDHNVLDGLVRRSLALVIDRNLQANADRYGVPQFGSHLERYLVDAMRRLASSSPNWIPNREKSLAWLGPDGLFLLWPQSAHDVQALLEADQLAGIPKAPETMLDLLLEAGVFARQPDGASTWFVLPPELKSAAEAVKLTSPAILLASIDKAPVRLPTTLACAPGATRSAPKPPASAPLPAPTPPPGTQFSLLDATASGEAPFRQASTQPAEARDPTPLPPVVPTLPVPEQVPPAPAAPPAVPTFRLNAPMRMNPAVRDALAAIVVTLNGPGSAAAATPVAEGLFVPLAELEQRGVQPALAARALADVGLLMHSQRDGPATVSCDFRGEPTIGLVVAPACIDGFDPAAFEPPAPVEP